MKIFHSLPRFPPMVRSAAVVVFFVCFIVFRLPAVFADSVQEKDVLGLTNNVLTLVNQYFKAGVMEREQALGKIKDTINQRKAVLLSLLDDDPDRVGHLLLPSALIKGLPEEIQPLLESDIDVQGSLQVLIEENFDSGTSRMMHVLTDEKTQRRYHLRMTGRIFEGATGSVWHVKGVAVDDRILVAANGSGSVQSVKAAASAPIAAVSGDQKTIVMLVNFTDANSICSSPTARSTVFDYAGTTVNTHYQESAFGNVSFSGDVVGPFTINYSITSGSLCGDYSVWQSLADAQATNSGIVLSQYTRRLYLIPPVSCNWAGTGTIGGNPSLSWVQGPYCSYPTVVAHELGHNLGMNHASSVSSNGAVSEYGDSSDIMGNTYVGSYPYYSLEQNAPHKVSMGWIPSTRVQTVTNSGTFVIDSVENGFPSNPQVLKIRKADTNEDYYVSFRQPVGFDAGLSSLYSQKTNIHRWNGSSSMQTFFLNSIDDGVNFVDSVNGITIQQVAHTASQATVSVALTSSVCNKTSPLVSITPASNAGPKGSLLNYTVTVTNQNSLACSSSTYKVSSVLPASWKGTFSPSLMILKPLASASVTWSVTSSSQASDGDYVIFAKAADMSNANYYDLKNASYVVFTDIAAPNISIISPSDGSVVSGKVGIAASAMDNVGVQKVEFYIDGTFKATDTSAPYVYTWNTSSLSRGNHTVFAKAYDLSGNAAVSPTVTVSK